MVDNPQETLEKMDDLIMSAEWDSNLDEIDVMMKKKYRNVKKNSHENPMVKEANRCNVCRNTVSLYIVCPNKVTLCNVLIR